MEEGEKKRTWSVEGEVFLTVQMAVEAVASCSRGAGKSCLRGAVKISRGEVMPCTCITSTSHASQQLSM